MGASGRPASRKRAIGSIYDWTSNTIVNCCVSYPPLSRIGIPARDHGAGNVTLAIVCQAQEKDGAQKGSRHARGSSRRNGKREGQVMKMSTLRAILVAIAWVASASQAVVAQTITDTPASDSEAATSQCVRDTDVKAASGDSLCPQGFHGVKRQVVAPCCW